MRLSVTDPVHIAFLDQRNFLRTTANRFENELKICYAITEEVKRCNANAIEWQQKRWWFSDNGPGSLKGLKCKAGPSYYILHERNRRLQAIRARLRFDRASLNASLNQRRVIGYDSPLCATCNMADTIDHCLLECKSYDAERKAANAEFNRHGLQLNLDTVLLGDANAMSSVQLSTCLQISSVYLLAIDAQHKL